MPVLIAATVVLGLAVGSFLNVVIHRVPRGESIVAPRSHCPCCNTLIAPQHNIPVVSWVLLRGRCAECAEPISVRYPLVELGTAAMFAAVTAQVAHLHDLAALPAYLFFAAVGIALSAIDLDVRRLPNAIVHPAYLVLGVLLTVGATFGGGLSPLVRAGIGAAAMFVGFLLLAVAYPGGMGFGDVKLAGLVGAVLGYLSYSALIVGAIAAFLLGGAISAILMLLHRADRKSAIPFGPAMLAGAAVAIFAAGPLAGSYVHLVHRA
jgi:leader peptidase (prepilin peptidase) / N-methyltransferase